MDSRALGENLELIMENDKGDEPIRLLIHRLGDSGEYRFHSAENLCSPVVSSFSSEINPYGSVIPYRTSVHGEIVERNVLPASIREFSPSSAYDPSVLEESYALVNLSSRQQLGNLLFLIHENKEAFLCGLCRQELFMKALPPGFRIDIMTLIRQQEHLGDAYLLQANLSETMNAAHPMEPPRSDRLYQDARRIYEAFRKDPGDLYDKAVSVAISSGRSFDIFGVPRGYMLLAEAL